MQISRRSFMKGALSTAGVTALNLSSPLAHAFQSRCDTSQPYKALVGINLAGGNDGFNCFIPKSPTYFEQYQQLRSSLAFDQQQIIDLKLNDGGIQLGLSPELADLQWLFDENKALPMVNVGPLMMPRQHADTIEDMQPTHIFSHNHQSAVTQTYTDSHISNEGWGARSAYLLGSSFDLENLTPLFELGSQSIWTNSVKKSANRIGTSLPSDMVLKEQGEELYDAFRQPSLTQGSLFKEYYAELCFSAEESYEEFEKIFSDNNDYGFDLETSMGQQLRVVLLLLLSRDKFQHPAQFFSVTLGGFDTHSSQQDTQGALLRQLASQVSIFYHRLEEFGLSESVTTFTFSEFGRTLEPNGSGTDHGWGNCQMVLGGDVQGGQMLGQWPDLTEDSDDLLKRGRAIPTTSADVFHASLLHWLGIDKDDFKVLFPRIEQFSPNLLPIFRSCDGGNENKLTIAKVSASAENPNGLDKVAHAIDGDLNTKWSASGTDVSYTVELESMAIISSVLFAQAKGDQRSYFVDIEVSTDGFNYEHITHIRTDGTSDGAVKYPLGSVEGKYVRFNCQGNSDDTGLGEWNNFSHIEVLGH